MRKSNLGLEYILGVSIALAIGSVIEDVFRRALQGETHKGLADQRGIDGDLLVVVDIEVPEKISKEEKELLEKLSEMKNFKK